MKINKAIIFKAIFVLVVFPLCLLVGLVIEAQRQRGNDNTGQPRNAHLVAISDRGIFREQTMCSGDDCLVLRLPGVTGVSIDKLGVDGKTYLVTEKEVTFETSVVGVYCLGAVDLNQCLMVTVPGDTCAKEITEYFGFRARYVPDSCVKR